MDDRVNTPTNAYERSLITIDGYIKAVLQLNEDSNKIKPDQRFLIGNANNWKCYKVPANGINNYMNAYHDDNCSSKLLEITLEADYVNTDEDDLVNGIPNANRNKYTVDINQGNIEQSIGFTTQLTATVKKGNDIVDSTVKWYTTNKNIANINSTTGVVTFVNNGVCSIGAYINDDINQSDMIGITVSPSIEDSYRIELTPYKYSIPQGDTTIYSCMLYKNDIAQEDVFTFEINTIVPNQNYVFKSINGNSFSIKNKIMSENAISINCKTGDHEKEFKIRLGGVW